MLKKQAERVFEAPVRPGPSIPDLFQADTRPVPPLLLEDHNDFASSEADHVDVDRFLSPQFHKLEVDRMWSRVWQIACHEDQIQNVGDYVVYEIGDKSLIVARTAPDTIKAFHNACLHKGRMICEKDGHVANFRCKFHGFMWKLDGTLGFVPSRWDFPRLRDEDFKLPEARVERWSGFVFINLNPDAAPLEDYLADLPEHFKDWGFQNRRLVGHVGQVIRANWKICVEAFLEFFHGMTTHPQVMVSSSDVNTRYVARKDRPHYAYMVIPQAVASPWVADKVDGQMTLEALFETVAIQGQDDARRLPPGRNVREYWAELARARMANSAGRDFSAVSDTEMIDVWVYALFPNIALWGGYMAPFWFRFRPWRNDPEMSLMEVFIMPELPEGAPRPPAPKMTLLGPDQKFSDAPELAGVGEFFDQDLGNLEWVQRGLHVTQKREITMSGYQESENRHFHTTLDAYVHGNGPAPSGQGRKWSVVSDKVHEERNMKALGPEPSLEAASRRSLAEIDAMIADTADPWHRAMFTNWRDHYWAEVVGDLDAIMATLSRDPIYRFYGSSLFGPMSELNTTEAVSAIYGGAIEMGYRPAGPISELLVTFGDAALMLQFKLTCVYPGAMLHPTDQEIDPAAAYRVTFRVSESHPYDRATGLMGGEIVFMSAPEEVVRIER